MLNVYSQFSEFLYIYNIITALMQQSCILYERRDTYEI